jgi:hypothetical protein
MTKVLVFTPTWEIEGGLAMRPECENTVFMQDIDGTLDHHIGRVNPFPIGDHRNVLAQYQIIQREFLQGDWDALLTFEHDHLLPDTDAVQRLIDTGGDVVYAPYLLRSSRTLSLWQWLPNGKIGASLSGYPRELAQARSENIWRVAGVGFGCTLMRRRVLEMIAFRETGPRDPCPDLAFAQDCARLGFISLARLDVPVSHCDNEEWLMPFEDDVARFEHMAPLDWREALQ